MNEYKEYKINRSIKLYQAAIELKPTCDNSIPIELLPRVLEFLDTLHGGGMIIVDNMRLSKMFSFICDWHMVLLSCSSAGAKVLRRSERLRKRRLLHGSDG